MAMVADRVLTVIEVAIGPGPAPGRFKVEVLRSPAGEASAIAELDVPALLGRRSELGEVLRNSAVAGHRGRPELERSLREFGEVLFAALLGTGQVAGCYRASTAVAATRQQRLRVVLRIDTPALAALPWEAMYDGETGAYLCRGDQLVRHVPVGAVSQPLAVRPPLRILGVLSSAPGLYALDIRKERALLTRALEQPVSEGLVDLSWAPAATWPELHDLLLGEEWHVVHFAGHGSFDPGRGAGLLALTGADGGIDVVSAGRFVDLLGQARSMPRLVVLNCCSGAGNGVDDLFADTATTLVRGGVSAVAAMQFEISDVASVAFTRGFYAAVARGLGVDDAVSSGRAAILGLSEWTLEWITPVLYLRGDDARLFLVSAGAGAPARAAPAERAERAEPAAVTVASRPARVLRHGGLVIKLAFSPDGRQLVTSASDGLARLWDVASGDLVHTLAGHSGNLVGVAFSPDGVLVATAGVDGTARLWEAASGVPVRTLTGHSDTVMAVAFSPDGLLVTAGVDGRARLWDVASGAPVRTLAGHSGNLVGVAFSPDGVLVATAGVDGTARLWEAASGVLVRTLAGHSDTVMAVAFSPDGVLVATAGVDGTARLWEVASGVLVRTLAGHTDAVMGVAFSPDGGRLATASHDRTARLWEVASGAPVRILTGHTDSVVGVAFSPDGALLATASYDKTAQLWS